MEIWYKSLKNNNFEYVPNNYWGNEKRIQAQFCKMKKESNQTTKVPQFQIEILLQQVQWLFFNNLVGI